MTKKIWTGKTLREAVGVSSVIDTHHEGPTKRQTEARAGLDKFGGKSGKTPADFYRMRAERAQKEKAEREAVEKAKMEAIEKARIVSGTERG